MAVDTPAAAQPDAATVQRYIDTLRSFALQHGVTEENILRVLAGQKALGNYNFGAQHGRR